jgi:hypothetical protein
MLLRARIPGLSLLCFFALPKRAKGESLEFLLLFIFETNPIWHMIGPEKSNTEALEVLEMQFWAFLV